MSVNHYSTLSWQHHHRHHNTDTSEPTTTTNDEEYQKESLFEKTLTPSDVGKLNRLVIPKQHAEKYFPLNTTTTNAADTSSSSSSSEKGMLLSFEDESGKSWRFRYSYWNSSQSYVLTKGWSRFVKDKQLDPGDVVFFQRHRSDSRRLFIGWRRRGQPSNTTTTSMAPPYRHHHYSNPPSHSHYSHYGATVPTATETHSIIPSASTVNSRTVRLFGVNLECQMDEDDGDVAAAVESPCPDGNYGHNMYYYYSPQPNNMNIAFTGGYDEGARR